MRPRTYQPDKSVDISHLPKIEGYDFEQEFDFDTFMKSYSRTGFQASELGKAIEITKAMIREDVPIMVACTSNIVSSGLRDVLRYLVKHKKVHVLVTSSGAIEEDIMKTFMPFRLGDFHVKGKTLLDAGIGRIGNIFTTNEHYLRLEDFMRKVFAQLLEKQQETKDPASPSEIIKVLGEMLDTDQKEESIVYWAAKNNIPIYCPGFTDGSIGDLLYFFMQQHPDIRIDIAKDHQKIVDYCLGQDKRGALILGGGIAKHYLLNANIFKEGLNYAVYISTAQFYDGSDSGGNQEEAVSWQKIHPDAMRVKVYAEATLVFPLLVAATFAKK